MCVQEHDLPPGTRFKYFQSPGEEEETLLYDYGDSEVGDSKNNNNNKNNNKNNNNNNNNNNVPPASVS